jgi:predicted nucleic acid-binding Zn ribbon protein
MADVEPVTEKQCSGCSRWLGLEEFPLNCRMHLGRSSRCRECHRAATKDWRDRNRERINAERRVEYRAEHPLPEKRCVVCGGSFTKRPDALVCGEECRRERRREQRRSLRRESEFASDHSSI